MRIPLGVFGPLYLQVSILFLYSAIRYSVFDRSLIIIVVILLFPALILSVLAPFTITYSAQLSKKIGNRLNNELDHLLVSTTTYSENDESRTLLVEGAYPLPAAPRSLATQGAQRPARRTA